MLIFISIGLTSSFNIPRELGYDQAITVPIAFSADKPFVNKNNTMIILQIIIKKTTTIQLVIFTYYIQDNSK